MNLIVAVDENWAIGRGGQLLFTIPGDLKYFQQKTTGQVVVMGHATLRSLPNSQPLKNRTNIVLSRQTDLEVADAQVCHSIAELAEVLKQYDKDQVWLIGGEKIYGQLLEACSEAYVTKVVAKVEADKWLPDLGKLPNWQLVEQSDAQVYNDLTYYFTRYINLKQAMI